MRTELFQIGTIPAVLYGESAGQGYVFLHGQMGCKEEAEAFAQVVCPKGYQVLSIDLPGHGARQERGEELLPWTAVPDIRAARDWAERHWKAVSLRATSIGTYFAMLAFPAPERVLLVSPVLDMEGLIQTMMGWAGGLFLISKYPGWDPDVSKDLNPLYYGVDRLTVPQPRMFTFGINITI